MDRTNALLAELNAFFTAGSLACMLLGFRAIRSTPRQVTRHRNFMLAACALAAAFLVGFVLRFVWYGPTKLEHASWVKVPFYLLYFTHEPLAVVNVFLVVAALFLGLSGRYRQHREVAPVAFWIWAYVSVSGIAIFLFLYPGRAPLLGLGAADVTRAGAPVAHAERR